MHIQVLHIFEFGIHRKISGLLKKGLLGMLHVAGHELLIMHSFYSCPYLLGLCHFVTIPKFAHLCNPEGQRDMVRHRIRWEFSVLKLLHIRMDLWLPIIALEEVIHRNIEDKASHTASPWLLVLLAMSVQCDGLWWRNKWCLQVLFDLESAPEEIISSVSQTNTSDLASPQPIQFQEPFVCLLDIFPSSDITKCIHIHGWSEPEVCSIWTEIQTCSAGCNIEILRS